MNTEKLRRIQNYFLPKKENEYLYCFKMSKYVKVFTLFSFITILSLMTILFINSSISYLYWWLPLILFCILMLSVIIVPIALYFDEKEIEIHSILEVVDIKVTSIKSIHKLDRNYAKDYFIPVLASFGFLGHNGLYYDIMLKRWIKMCCSEKSNLIMIECLGKKFYVISASEEREAIIELISRKAKKHQDEILSIVEDNFKKIKN